MLMIDGLLQFFYIELVVKLHGAKIMGTQMTRMKPINTEEY